MRIKRLLAYITLIAMFTTFVGCGDDGIVNFSFTEESAESSVQGNTNPLNQLLPAEVFPPLKLNIDLQQELEAQDATGARGVYLQKLTLNITDTAKPVGDEDNFDFLDEVTLYVESTKENSTLKRLKIAELKPVPEGKTEVQFTVDDGINLKPYIEEGVRLSSEGKGSVPPDDTTLKAKVTLRVQVL